MVNYWEMDAQDLKNEARGTESSSKEWDFVLAISNWLATYHSDYRWKVYSYLKPNKDSKYDIIPFSGQFFEFMDF